MCCCVALLSRLLLCCCTVRCADVLLLCALFNCIPVSRCEAGLDGGREGALITRERHRFHVQACLAALQRFLGNPGQVDMAAEELRLAVHSLAVLTGRVEVEDLLDVVFRDFCIGK